jgi:hypothetical protein
MHIVRIKAICILGVKEIFNGKKWKRRLCKVSMDDNMTLSHEDFDFMKNEITKLQNTITGLLEGLVLVTECETETGCHEVARFLIASCLND